jgi:hypothetical protein
LPPAGFSVPHCKHLDPAAGLTCCGIGDPQLAQNLLPSGLSTPHFWHLAIVNLLQDFIYFKTKNFEKQPKELGHSVRREEEAKGNMGFQKRMSN